MTRHDNEAEDKQILQLTKMWHDMITKWKLST